MKIAVASCALWKQKNGIPVPQEIWGEIQAEEPDVLLLLGDNVYLTHDKLNDPVKLARELRGKYDRQFGDPHFKALLNDVRRRGGTTLAIYDDHDFLGDNRYGRDNKKLREKPREELRRAFPEPSRPGELFYCHTAADGLVDIVVLDERYDRSQPDMTDVNGVLGKPQWTWFEDVVRRSTSKFLVVASSTTIHPSRNKEQWRQYGKALDRLKDLLRRKGTLVLSGDVHWNAVYADPGDLVEVVTSGVFRRVDGEERRNYGILTFDETGVDVDLRSLQPKWIKKARLKLDAWP